MAEITNALLATDAYQGPTPTLDLARGGQFGYAPDIKNWVSNQSYIRQQLNVILLEVPEFIQYMPNPQKWVEALKAMVELHPKSITGFNAGLEVSVTENEIGGGGEVQEEVSDVKRTRSTPTFVYGADKYGSPIVSLLESWITVALKDPNTKRALINTLPDGAPDAMLANMYAMTVLAYEPDPTGKKVHRAWIMRNMFPKGTGEIIGSKDPTAPIELEELSVEFAGFAEYTQGTIGFAQKILDRINTTNANPNLQPSFITDLEANVKAVDDQVGYRSGVETIATEVTNAGG